MVADPADHDRAARLVPAEGVPPDLDGAVPELHRRARLLGHGRDLPVPGQDEVGMAEAESVPARVSDGVERVAQW